MAESTRALPPPLPLAHGGWEVQSLMTSTDYTIRGLALLPPNSIVPVIVVPGIMGTNLRARRLPKLGGVVDQRNRLAKPGEAVWRAPNGMVEGALSALRWDRREPRERQLLFDSSTLEVDDGGPIVLGDASATYVPSESQARERGWGEVHAGSYGRLLAALQGHLNQTFGFNDVAQKRFVAAYWQSVMTAGSQDRSVDIEPLTEAHLTKHAGHYYPVYAFGYNWLEDCGAAAVSLERRVADIVASWRHLKRSCDKVILITHSMGGLVARACAKRIPDRIAGVIHGVMPAWGAPAAYRRLACGTEDASPVHGMVTNVMNGGIAKLQGNAVEKTTPVMAVAPGVLELLPNHRHPQPWLHVRALTGVGDTARADGRATPAAHARESSVHCFSLPAGATGNPYDLYRDMSSWYRLINPELADPAGKWAERPGAVVEEIERAIATAEKFHRALDDYYHPVTYAFYGADEHRPVYGEVRWRTRHKAGAGPVLTPGNVAAAKFLADVPGGGRRVVVEAKSVVEFDIEPQDATGDGTVSLLSGSAPAGKIRQLFATRGYDHQNAFNDKRMIMLTLRLVVKIVQELP